MFKYKVEPKKDPDNEIQLVVALEHVDKHLSEQRATTLYFDLRQRIIAKLADRFIERHGDSALAGIDPAAIAKLATVHLAQEFMKKGSPF